MSETQEFMEEQNLDEQFDAGFELGGDDATADGQEQKAAGEDAAQSEEMPEQEQTQPREENIAPERITDGERPQPVQQPGQLEKAPENIAEEWENLNRLNPAAAKLALEDSAEGEAIRRRLENYGAEQAQDRAEMTLYRRNQEREAIDAHNRLFMETIRRKNPDYYAMITDEARRPEAAQYLNSVFQWIAQKPYTEAQKMMEIARTGRDPNQICALIDRFEKEKDTGKRPDATGAFAVPSRGAPAAPAGIGDMDDFDAGWNMNQ